MKKIFFAVLALLSLSGCAKDITITVENTADFDRNNEMVEITANELQLTGVQYVLLNAEGNEIPYQIIACNNKDMQSFIFQADVKAGEKAAYTLKRGIPAAVAPKVSARQVPERKDDFAWENDRAAYRMYGPALAGENPSNGVDLWLKKTDELIVDTFYYNELQLGQSYHVDHGKGIDCYKVGNKPGCGGIAPFAFDTLWTGRYYDRYQILEAGPLRTIFTLEYDSVRVNGQTLTEKITITVDAGAQLNKAAVVYNGNSIEGMQLAAGIYLHDSIDNMQLNLDEGWIAYAEKATSDAGLPSGRNYVAVILPGAVKENVFSNTLLAYANYAMGDTVTYYFGGGWSEWCYPTDEDWFTATANTAKAIANPLKVSVAK